MQRNVRNLASEVFDLVVIGGGIYGVQIAWDAALRGLKVALVERGDFGHATSANSLKIIHGGLRHLQRADVLEMRRSAEERRILMHIAPHLVQPLPVLVPAYGHGLHGREALWAGLKVYSILSGEGDPSVVEEPRFLSPSACLDLVPDLPADGLTGGVVYYDAQVHNSERLLLSILHSAYTAGVRPANYAEVTGFHSESGRIRSVEIIDHLSGDLLHVHGDVFVNAAGPWVQEVLDLLGDQAPRIRQSFARAMNICTSQPLSSQMAVGLLRRDRDLRDTSPKMRSGRYFFVVPWKGKALTGTWYWDGKRASDEPTRLPELARFIDALQQANPACRLTTDDVVHIHHGRVPIENDGNRRPARLQTSERVYDHSEEGLGNLITVVGVKLTTARSVAERIVDRVLVKQGRPRVRSLTATTPVHGGDLGELGSDGSDQDRREASGGRERELHRLIRNHGSSYHQVLRQASGPTDHDPLATLRAEVLHGVRNEMAVMLSDVVMRRTELGAAGHPGREMLAACAAVMGAELGWSEAETRQQLHAVEAVWLNGGLES